MNTQVSAAPFPDACTQPGAILQGTYRIVAPLAEGGCGEVYLADHMRLPGQFAIKVLHRGLMRNAEVLSRFRQEAEITSTLHHPHIVQVLDFNVTEQGSPYLVMELLQGKSLTTRIGEGGALPPRTAVDIIRQISQALHAAHVRGIVHRDLKPDNVILLSGDGVEDFVKVLDFGISQARWCPRLTEGAQIAGTPQYMAPEQACGLRDAIEPRTDQFSLAAIAYTLLTGREPFVADDPIAVLYQVVHVDPAPPSKIVPALGTGIDAVIMRGLSKQPVDRFPDVLSFAAALRQAVTGELDTPPVERVADLEPRSIRAVETPHQLSPAGQETRRLIRRMRPKLYRTRRRIAVLAMAGALTLTWRFSPSTRVAAHTAWHRARVEAQELVAAHVP
ncbi:MAG TPA: serine/threonine-protein kinase [Polyangia bacterium]|nr:serine/threonine-protein kinase [Polyangia bacterium]